MNLDHQHIHLTLPHAVLEGELVLPHHSQGLVIFVAGCGSAAMASAGEIDQQLYRSGFGTLTIDLLIESECHYADAESHLPHLVERLLAVITHLHRLMDSESIAEQPIGLVAAGTATPVAARVAALRDKEVKALVCHGGLIDLAGLQFLKVLQAPLLMIADAEDERAATNLQRARPHIAAPVGFERLASEDAGDEGSAKKNAGGTTKTANIAVAHTVRWFQQHLRR
ncbi:MAG: hypothetical protein IPO00_17510 [Betaproteobacteria bacterium]|nr:hypothetical protein [Betaproteobacteria bacterium]